MKGVIICICSQAGRKCDTCVKNKLLQPEHIMLCDTWRRDVSDIDKRLRRAV